MADERAQPLTDDEKGELEALLGRAAGDENLFERKRRDAATKAKIAELREERRVSRLARQPLLAEPGAVQLPRFVFTWLVGDEARDGAWSVMDVGMLAALLAAFANDDRPCLWADGSRGRATTGRLLSPAASAATTASTARSAGRLLRPATQATSACERRLPRFTATSGSRSSRRSQSFGSGSASER